MMSNKGDGEKRLMCPYEKSHTLLASRMQTHLVKCRQQHLDVKMVPCVNNTTHLIPEPELAFHMETCPDRGSLDKFMYASTTTTEDRFPVPILNLTPTETWDDDFHPTYNPEEHCVNNPILRNKNTLSQAERRKFRNEERQRMQKFQTKIIEETPKELQQKGTTQNQVRRPNTISAGVHNQADLEEDDVSGLLARISLDKNKVTFPKMNRNVAVDPTSSEELQINGAADAMEMQGVKKGKAKQSKGRGRGLAQN